MSIAHKIKCGINDASCHVRDHIVPRQSNNYKPHALKHDVLFGYSIILILLKVIVVLGPVALPSSSLYSSAITPQNIIDLTNQARKNLNLQTLNRNKNLSDAATAKAQDMLARQYFAHLSPDGKRPWDWIKNSGYKYLYAGENLAVHFHEAEDVQSGWMASPTHRANIVSDNYSEIGVGTATGTFEGVKATFVVQMFGRPTPLLASTAPVNTNSVTPPATTQPSGGEVAGTSSGGVAPTTTPAPVIDPNALLVDEGSVAWRSTKTGYVLRVTVHNATGVAVLFGDKQTPLQSSTDGQTWYGEIPVAINSISQSGEPIFLVVTGKNGQAHSTPLALAAPSATTQKFFTFNDGADKFTTFFGFLHIGNLDDSVRKFYIGFVVFLAAALLINLFVVRLRILHPSLVTHTMVVLLLGIVLAVV